MQIKRVKQSTPWSCTAACLAMLSGRSLDDVFEWFGHEGGQMTHGVRRGFTLTDAHRYLTAHGYILGAAGWYQNGVRMGKAPTEISIGGGPALVITLTERNTTHAVVWDGWSILDPAPSAAASEPLTKYSILYWWPIGRIVGERRP